MGYATDWIVNTGWIINGQAIRKLFTHQREAAQRIYAVDGL